MSKTNCIAKKKYFDKVFYKFQHTSIWGGQIIQAKQSILKCLLLFINYNLSTANCTNKTTYFGKLKRNGARERVACCCVLLACRGWSWGRFWFFNFVHIFTYIPSNHSGAWIEQFYKTTIIMTKRVGGLIHSDSGEFGAIRVNLLILLLHAWLCIVLLSLYKKPPSWPCNLSWLCKLL